MTVWELTITDLNGYEVYASALYISYEVAKEAKRLEREDHGDDSYSYAIDEKTVHMSATFDEMVVPIEEN